MKNFKFLAAFFLSPVIWLPVNGYAGWVESMIGEIVEEEVEKFFVPDAPPTIVDINCSGTKRINNQLFIAGDVLITSPSSRRYAWVMVIEITPSQLSPHATDFTILTEQETESSAAAISGDPFITGYTHQGGATPFQAFLYNTESGLFQELGAFSEVGFSYGTAVDELGKVVAGNATLAADGVGEGLELLHAVRWTGESEIEDLGSLAGPTGTSRAFDISGDGSVIVGETELPSGVIHAFRWTEQEGFEDLGAVGTGRSVSTAITFDGEVIVGGSGKAFRWSREVGMIELGAPEQAAYSIATSVSSNGAVVVGNYDDFRFNMDTDGTAEFSNTSRVFRWTDSNLGGDGVIDLQSLLEADGVDFAGMTLVSADGVSEDGQFIWGLMIEDDAVAFEPVPYLLQYCDSFVDACADPDWPGWPFPFSGVSPDPELDLDLNNISALNPLDGLIYSCTDVLFNGEPGEYNGVAAYDIAFGIVSLEQGVIGVVKARPFNESMALNEEGELPDCSGSIDLATNIYTDTIQAGREVYSARFELFDGELLLMRLLDITLIGLTP